MRARVPFVDSDNLLKKLTHFRGQDPLLDFLIFTVPLVACIVTACFGEHTFTHILYRHFPP